MPTKEEVPEMLFELPEEDYRAVVKYIVMMTELDNERKDKEGDPFYSKANMDRIRHATEQIKQGKVVVKTMDELENMAIE